MEVVSRIGYVVHGAIYLVIGALAAGLAWGARGELADPPSAIEIIDKLPAGDVLVTLIAGGLAAYALWRFVQAIADPDRQGRTVKGVIVRAGRVISGIGYSALALFAGGMASGSIQHGGGEPNWMYRVLTEPLGAMAGGLVGLILLCVATDDVRKACTTNFGERLKRNEMSSLLTVATRCAGSWGFAARALVLVAGGVYLIRAVFADEPHRAKGFEGILAALFRLPYGDWVLGFVALGLAAYGLFMVQAGVFRRHPY
jgi:hypothetical protein